MTRATILIPAHNEAAVIERTLLHLSRGMSFADFRIVVIANACSDATAAKTRSILPWATVIETATAGKCHALNLGYQAADRDNPIICLDADLDVTVEALNALIRPLTDGTALATCGHMDVRTDAASPLVRAYYRGWRTNPYFDRGKFGGLFALSPQAASRVFPLPEITADDEYVRRSFTDAETRFVRLCRFSAMAPATVSSLLKVRRRSLQGARDVAAMGMPSPERGSLGIVARRAFARPSNAFPVAVYAIINGWTRLSLKFWHRGKPRRWDRDLTTRVSG